MATDLKISQLTDGSALQSADQLAVNRGGVNRRITASNLLIANSVTNAKLAQMADGTVKANISGGLADPSDVSLVSTNTNSSVVLRDASGDFAANRITLEGVFARFVFLTGSTSGVITVQVPAIAGTHTVTLPAGSTPPK